MSWITPEDVAAAYSENVTQEFIDHVQGLAESCVGEQETVSAQLKATFVEVVYRKHLANQNNPRGLTQETVGDHSYSMASAAGLGLSELDCRSLKKAAGQSALWVQPLARGPVESGSPERSTP